MKLIYHQQQNTFVLFVLLFIYFFGKVWEITFWGVDYKRYIKADS